MRFVAFLQQMTLNAISIFSVCFFLVLSYKGFQESITWGAVGIVVGVVGGEIIFRIGKILHRLLFAVIYAVVTPKEIKSAIKSARHSNDEKREPRCGGEDGLTPGTAITFNFSNITLAIPLALAHIRSIYGENAKLNMKQVTVNSRTLRVYSINSSDGTEAKLYFDFSNQ